MKNTVLSCAHPAAYLSRSRTTTRVWTASVGLAVDVIGAEVFIKVLLLWKSTVAAADRPANVLLAHDTPQTLIGHKTKIDRNETLVNWCRFSRHKCENWVERNSGEIGGTDENGEAIVVEMEETKYCHRKHQRQAASARALGVWWDWEKRFRTAQCKICTYRTNQFAQSLGPMSWRRLNRG